MKTIKALIKNFVGFVCLSSLFLIAADSPSIWMQLLWYIGCLTTTILSGLLFGRLQAKGW